MPAIMCPKCGSGSVATDRKLDPPHTCTECWRAFDDADVKSVLGDDVEVEDGKSESMFPDVVGEILGWRAWYIVDTPEGVRLRSLNTGAVIVGDHAWTPGEIQYAKCPKGIHTTPSNKLDADLQPFHLQVPAESCSCGFYAAISREHLISLNHYHLYEQEYGMPKCIGQVAMAGKVIPGAQGWKAQQVWPTKLYVPFEFWRLVKPLQVAYGIPVELARTLEKEPRKIR